MNWFKSLDHKIKTAHSLRGSDWTLVLEAWAWLLFMDLSLYLRPFQAIISFSEAQYRKKEDDPSIRKRDVILRFQRMVDMAAGNHLHSMGCLRRALVLKCLLGRRGIDTMLRIGVRKEAGIFYAHAWLDYENVPIEPIGNEHEAFEPLKGLRKLDFQNLESFINSSLSTEERPQMQKITPFLWFDDQAEEAVKFYTSIFKDSHIGGISRYGDEMPALKGKAMSITFQLEGQEFMALNGGPHFSFSPAISFFVKCKTQQEVDHYWKKLSAGGQEEQCGWLKDKYGVSWQIIPTILGDLLGGSDPAGAQRALQAMLKMVKLDIALLQQAYDHE